MYLKLSIRNARRSFVNYLLYVAAMTVMLAIIEVSNCISIVGEAASFQVISLPLLIAAIQIVLVGYMDTFILRQRAKEFATYMLLGMEKDKLSLVFLCELSVIGLVCFLLGVALGTGIFSICCHTLLQKTGSHSIFRIILNSTLQTFVYFCCVEILSIFFMKRKIYKLQIVELIREKQRKQPLDADNKTFWS